MDTNDLKDLVDRCDKLKAFCKLCVSSIDGLRFNIIYSDSSVPRPTSKSQSIDECDSSIICSDIRKIVNDRIEEVEKQIKLVVNG